MPPLTGASGSTSRLIDASGGALSSAYGSERKALSVSTCSRLTPVARMRAATWYRLAARASPTPSIKLNFEENASLSDAVADRMLAEEEAEASAARAAAEAEAAEAAEALKATEAKAFAAAEELLADEEKEKQAAAASTNGGKAKQGKGKKGKGKR